MILVWAMALSLMWVGMTGVTTLANLFAGFALGALVLMVVRRDRGPSPFTRLRRGAALAAYFLWELLVANLRVAYDVVTPTYYMRPAVVGIPLDASTDVEITLLANLISLTPGTLSLDVSPDRRTLYVHGMFVGDRDAFVASIKNGLERRLLEVLR
jgi:multicomponent Na+:H+ antiporter subunit E